MSLERAATGSVTVITGPTASGKTALALELAQSDPAIEIVNADAQLLYRGFDIGTAKPSAEDRSRTNHHMLDLLEPTERYSAAEYSGAARAVIRQIIRSGGRPVVVGGTGFYIEALFHGLSPIEADAEKLHEAKERFKRAFAERGFADLHNEVRSFDAELYQQIAREMNPIRLERAWSYFHATGIALGDARKAARDTFELWPEYVILEVPRPELLERIERRVDAMLAAGWLEEVKGLLEQGVTLEMPAMRSIGYRELAEVCTGQRSLLSAREAIILRTRQYAKRQVTWLRHNLT